MSEQALLEYSPHAIAIVGLAGRFPDARSLDDFWRNIRDGLESLETLGDAELDAAGVPVNVRSNRQFVRKGTTLEGALLFDARFFGLSPREALIRSIGFFWNARGRRWSTRGMPLARRRRRLASMPVRA